ncbi:MAG: aldo/keto reductase [Candidatus Gottesmanbacteria bacterium]|nr:aldo/keto reductase [Candidatus Gottesmanbacteria bacterium]
MNYRTLGKTGWMVSELGHGMWGMGSWTGSDDTESMEALHRSVELGVNFFDTAWVYGNGRSEKLLGNLLKAYPNKHLYTATKIPPKSFRYPMKPEYKLSEEYPSGHLVEYVQKSLKNMGLDKLDLVLLHGWDDVWADDERWQKAVQDLKRKGLIQAFGISIDRWEPENAIKAMRTGLVDVVEVIYNIFDQAPEDKLFPACRELNVGVIARVPFDEGTLTGTLRLDSHWPKGDWRNSYFGKENLQVSVARAEALKKILPKEMILSELALRFILFNSDVCTVIPGMRKVKNVDANVKASDKGALRPELMKQLRSHRWNRKPNPSAG